VLAVADAFEPECPLDEERAQADEAMAIRIAESVAPEPGPRRAFALADLLAPLVEHAVAACHCAEDTAVAAELAQRRLIEARAAGGCWIEPLEEWARVPSGRRA
jgi:hypothetical protein